MPLEFPDAMPQAFADAWMARDARALAWLFAPDADFVNVVGIWWHGRDRIEAAHHHGLTRYFAHSRLTPGRVEQRQLGPDAAVVRCRYRLSGQTTEAGDTAAPRSTMMIFVMQRSPEGWHCVAAQNTDIHPGAETHEAAPEGLRQRPVRKGAPPTGENLADKNNRN
ncbi:SgcJ/EcaC family oxidoreductase [Alkalilacustris brevis]|uniref:SgcJ/EcaC family oxidoreductase n=1 Tax=Alkalilacustris brevis TaxID=2026338 RepID=UPI000E0D4777|nr:SgcJ/EcaC family oxidoreductase [Alkalilacustris brevis]